jgi:AIPR protein
MEAGGDNKALAKFETRSDLQAYGSNALLLFALQLRWGMTDIEGVAAEALTDASNDKKCDLVYVDRENGRVVVGQGYMSGKTDLTAAPSSKASDLNTAVTWLLSGDLDGLPAVLKSAAEEVRDAIEQDEIREFHIWYVHNAPESANVADELKQAVTTADALLHTHFSETQVEVTAMEIGVSELDRLYRRTEATIAVTDELKVTVPGGFESSGQGWSAYTTSVPGVWLREQWQKYGEDLMSPNVRAYLGIVRSERNINNGIKTTAKETPDRFWIYNNGITILVHDYAVAEPDGTGEYEVTLKGAGIVNGAQTTGSISTLADDDAPDLGSAQVLTRFVRTEDPEVLGDVIKFNNTQNKVEAADFRSKDEVQERLRKEFEDIPDADYKGARRGGIQDAIERPANRLSDRAVAQALAGFQLAPNLAYNETRRIWEENGVYSRFFSERVTARHVIFVFSLLRALEATKRRVNEIPEGERTEAQTRHVQFFRGRGSTITMLSAISSSIELFLGRQVPDRAALRFKDNCSPADAANCWQPIIDVVLSFSGTLLEATDLGLKKQENVQDALRRFQEMVEATAEANRERYEEFSAKVELAD